MKIPKSEYSAFRAFVAEPEASLQALAQSLESQPPPIVPGGWSSEGLVALVGRHVDSSRASDITRLLVSLASVRRHRDESAEETIVEVDAALVNQPEANVDLAAFRERQAVLTRLIGAPTIGLLVKVWELGMEMGNAVADLRLLTDIRPVFDEEATRPLLGVVTHTLRVRMLDDSGPLGGTFNLTLDGADLVQLAAQVDRALRKADAIRSTMGPALEHGICLLNELEEDQ